jgi:hypothetical protein
MSKRIYSVVLVLSIIGLLVLYFVRENIGVNGMLGILFLFSMVFVTSIHGIVAHSINPQLKGGLIVYPVLMGVLFALLFFICVFVILPLYYPEFRG